MYRTLLGIVGALVAALIVVGLTFSGSADEGRAEFVFVNGTEPKTLDPGKMTGQPEGRIAEAIFEGLTRYEAKSLKPVPGAAASWETSPDGLRWTFHLRPGVRWSNGDPLTAHDFVYAWVRLQEPAIASEYSYLMHFVRHAAAYNTYEPQVAALRGAEGQPGIVQQFRDLASKSPQGLDVTAWQAFASKSRLRGVVAGTHETVLLQALDRKDGSFTPEQTAALGTSLEHEAAERETALRLAREHFGKDQGVFAPDDQTFVVELNAFTPYFLELTAFYPNMPVHRPTVERWPDNWFLPGRIVSNGAYNLVSWQVNRNMRLERSETYWGKDEVALRTIDALPIDNRSISMNLYLTGKAEWAPSGYPPDLIDVLKKRTEDFYSGPGMIVYLYRFNVTRKPLDDPRVRHAIGLCIDRKTICEDVLRGGQVPATSLVAPGVPSYESPPSGFGFEPEKARKLLAEAGFPGGRGFPSLSIMFNTDEGHKKIAEFISSTLKKELNIDINPRNEEWQSYQESARRLNYDIVRGGWIGDYRDPNTFLDMWLTNGGNNQTGWGDPFYDRLIALAGDVLTLVKMPAAERTAIFARFKERARAEDILARLEAASASEDRLKLAADLRLQVFREAEAILLQDAFPVMPVYFYVVTGLKSPRLEGFYTMLEEEGGRKIPNLQDIHPLRDVRFRTPNASGTSPQESPR